MSNVSRHKQMSQALTVIFDCDGVLVDSERLSHEVLRQMIAEYGRELSLKEALDHFMGTSTERCLAVLSSLIGRPAPSDFLSVFRDRTFEAFAASLAPIPGVAGVLESLQLPFCVASNGPKEKMKLTLGLTGLLPHFEGRLFSAQDVARPKPAPDLFLHAAASMAARPSSCVVIEDSPTGVAAARAAGMRVVGYAVMGQDAKLQAAGAEILLQNMADLPHILQALRSAA
jgi:HAD superfamily hydrolase (TIGR01509 family)